MNELNYKNWEPLSITELVRLLNDFDCDWWLAGGYAIELFIGKSIRTHGDIDILIKREDQFKIQKHLSSWELYRATNPGLKLWGQNEFLIKGYQDIWCRPNSESPWQLQIMLFDTENENWIYKRNPEIKLPLEKIYKISETQIKYLNPEIQLLYKAKTEILDKDQIDFDNTIQLLDKPSRMWLLNCLKIQFPNGHPWITDLINFKN